jgi:hypothetical protein
MAIEYADREATTRPLNLEFHNKSFRGIVDAIVKEDPQYRVSFSNGIVDIFSVMAREDSSNLLNKIMKDFSVTEMETRLADSQLFCAVVQAAGSGGCAGSLAVGQWDPLRITLHLHNVSFIQRASNESHTYLPTCSPAAGLINSRGVVGPLVFAFCSC